MHLGGNRRWVPLIGVFFVEEIYSISALLNIYRKIPT